MITGFFLNIISSTLIFIISFLPQYTYPEIITTSITTMWGYISAFSIIFPIGNILTVIIISTFFHVVLWGWDFSVWIIHLIRGR